MFMIVTWLRCLCIYLCFFLSRSDALWHKQTGSSLQHLGFKGYVKNRIDYFVVLREPGKQMWLACSKDNYY